MLKDWVFHFCRNSLRLPLGGFVRKIHFDGFENFPKDKIHYYVEMAYREIKRRDLNPLELNRKEERKHQERVENWMRTKDPHYHSWQEKKITQP